MPLVNSASRPPIRVFLIEHHHLVRLGLISALSAYPTFEFVGHAESEMAAFAAMDELQVDVFVLSDEQGNDWLNICRQLRLRNPQAGIIVLMSDTDCSIVRQAISAGANACCLKDICAERLSAAIVGVSHGDIWIDSQIAWQLMDELNRQSSLQESCSMEKLATQSSFFCSHTTDDNIVLTAREAQVLKLIVRGQTNQAIADSLVISLATAKAHVRSILSKLGVDHRTQAAVEAMRRGLV